MNNADQHKKLLPFIFMMVGFISALVVFFHVVSSIQMVHAEKSCVDTICDSGTYLAQIISFPLYVTFALTGLASSLLYWMASSLLALASIIAPAVQGLPGSAILMLFFFFFLIAIELFSKDLKLFEYSKLALVAFISVLGKDKADKAVGKILKLTGDD